MDLIGKAIAALPVKSGVSQRTGEQWQSREYVIETQEQFKKRICFEVFGIDKLKEFNIRDNDLIKVHFDISAREYNGRWYNSIRAWKVEHVNPQSQTTETTPVQTSAPVQSPAPVQAPTPQSNEEELPF